MSLRNASHDQVDQVPMQRAVILVGAIASAAALFWFVPLFRVVPLGRVSPARQPVTFSAAAFAQDFWNTRLIPSVERAADAAAVLAAIREDPAQARERFARYAGLGRVYYYFVRGRGAIVSIKRDHVGVSLNDGNREPDLLLHTGLLFGNAVRDATGLLDSSDFDNSQHFNDISTKLNQIVEASVIPQLKAQARVGTSVDFVGCAEVRNDRDLRPLSIVPIRARFD